MGAQARQAARVESPVAWRDRYDLRRDRRQGSGRSGGRALCRDARCRYAGATGCRAPPGWQDGAPTQRPALRRPPWTGPRGVRRAAAADRTLTAHRPRRLDLSASRFERQRHRPVRLRSVGRVPGPVRRGFLRRQGHLRRGRVRGGPRRPRSRRHAAEPRPVRRNLRPRRPGLGHRVRGRVSGALRRRRCTRPSVGERRLAVAALGPGPRCGGRRPGPSGDSTARTVEDGGQPAPDAERTCGDRGPGGRVAAAPAISGDVDGVRRHDARHAGPAPGPGGADSRAQWSLQAQPCPGPRRGCATGPRADRPAADPACAPGVVDVRCDRADALPAAGEPPQPARVADGGAGAGERASRPARLLPAHGRCGSHRCSCHRAGRGRACECGACRAVRAAVDPVAGGRASGEPALAGRRGPACFRPRRSSAAARRAARLAVLRHLRDGRRSLAAAGQLPGGPAAGAGPPHVADQYRPLPAVGRQRPGLRLGRDARCGRAAGGNAGLDGPAGAIQRAFLQLVRHPGPAATRAPVRFVRRQWQPRGPPDHAGDCLRRDGGATGARTAVARRHRRWPRDPA